MATSKVTIAMENRAADKLYRIRPAVIPGTNVVVNEQLRLKWFNRVNEEAQRLFYAHGRKPTKDWFDRCGVPD